MSLRTESELTVKQPNRCVVCPSAAGRMAALQMIAIVFGAIVLPAGLGCTDLFDCFQTQQKLVTNGIILMVTGAPTMRTNLSVTLPALQMSADELGFFQLAFTLRVRAAKFILMDAW